MKINQGLLLISIATALAVPATVFAAKGEKKDKGSAVNFAACDKDGDGFVTKQEFMDAMKAANKKEQAAAKQFADKDEDNDGKLSKKEFAKKSGGKKTKN